MAINQQAINALAWAGEHTAKLCKRIPAGEVREVTIQTVDDNCKVKISISAEPGIRAFAADPFFERYDSNTKEYLFSYVYAPAKWTAEEILRREG